MPVRVHGFLGQIDLPELPPTEKFYGKLNGAGISEEDYLNANNEWDSFNCKTIGDYHDLYNQTDAFLTAVVLETFRKTYMDLHK